MEASVSPRNANEQKNCCLKILMLNKIISRTNMLWIYILGFYKSSLDEDGVKVRNIHIALTFSKLHVDHDA